MKIDFISPFNRAVFNAFQTMVGVNVVRKKPYMKRDMSNHGDITGFIGLADAKISGSIAMLFPQQTICKIYEQIIGEKVEDLNDDIQDAVGELANLVGGGAKTEFSEMGLSYEITIPMVVTGQDHEIRHKLDAPIIAIPYLWQGFPFLLEISIKLGNSKKTNS